MTVDPSEAVCFVILFPECRVFKIKMVQIFHEAGKSFMDRIIKQHPVLFALLIPFTELADLISHEIQLLARMCIHIHIQGTCLRELIIVISVHLLHDRCLAVNHLVMWQRKEKTCIIIIHHGEGELVIILYTIFRTGTEIIKCIVHPSHIPFIIKTKAALRNRISNFREGSGIFCCKDCRRVELF